MARTNPFLSFVVEEKKAVLESLDEYEITYRDLTKAEADGFTKRLIKGYGKDGKSPEIDYDASFLIAVEKIALTMIDPKVTVDELNSFENAKVTALIAEYGKLLEPEDDEGNDSTPEN